jgi:hypothetical protein
MTSRTARALAVLLAVAGLIVGVIAGCDYGIPAGSRGAAPSNILTCGRVVDSTGYKQGPLTANLAIASLTALPLAASPAGIAGGKPTTADVDILDTMGAELIGYSGTRLAADAQAFAVTEFKYHPTGPVNMAYARPLDQNIRALQRDCPSGLRLGLRWRRGAEQSQPHPFR